MQDTLEFDEETFYREWAAWEDQGMADYSVKVKTEWHSPSYIFFYRVIIKNYKLLNIESLDGKDYNHYYNDTEWDPIWEMYNSINSLYEEHKNIRGSIKILYSTYFHYPEFIAIDLPPKNPPTSFGSGAIYLSEFIPLTPAKEE